MKWLKLISNFFSGTLKRTGRAEVTLISMSGNPVLVKKNQIHRNQRQLNPNQYSAPKESEVAKSSSNFPIVELKDYDVAEKTIHDNQINHVSDKLKTKSTEAEENLKKPNLIS